MIGLLEETSFFAGSRGSDPLEVYWHLRCVRVGPHRLANRDLHVLLRVAGALLIGFDGIDCPLEWGP